MSSSNLYSVSGQKYSSIPTLHFKNVFQKIRAILKHVKTKKNTSITHIIMYYLKIKKIKERDDEYG